MNKKQRTAKTKEQVRVWVETQPHYQIQLVDSKEDHDIWEAKRKQLLIDAGKGREWVPIPYYKQKNAGFTVLTGITEVLRVKHDLWRSCPIKPGGSLDSRMFRWDNTTEFKEVWAE